MKLKELKKTTEKSEEENCMNKSKMSHETFIELCKRLVYENEISKEVSDEWSGINIFMEDVFIVWSCKTLQNSKAILSATNKGAYMYEFTMNGDTGEIYEDIYDKIKHKIINIKDK